MKHKYTEQYETILHKLTTRNTQHTLYDLQRLVETILVAETDLTKYKDVLQTAKTHLPASNSIWKRVNAILVTIQ